MVCVCVCYAVTLVEVRQFARISPLPPSCGTQESELSLTGLAARAFACLRLCTFRGPRAELLTSST